MYRTHDNTFTNESAFTGGSDNQMGQQWGTQTGNLTGQQSGQWAQQGSMQTGMQGGMQSGTQSTHKFGAHEIMMTHEVLTGIIDGINQFELYRPHIKDQSLMSILDNQVNHMYQDYQSMVNYLHNQGKSAAVPYRSPKHSGVKYGLRQPSPMEPNTSANNLDDRDVASGMLMHNKCSATMCTTAALECADFNLREMITNCSVSCINKAYEIFAYMNQKGMYQVPTLADQTTQTMVNIYQPGNMPQFQF